MNGISAWLPNQEFPVYSLAVAHSLNGHFLGLCPQCSLPSRIVILPGSSEDSCPFPSHLEINDAVLAASWPRLLQVQSQVPQCPLTLHSH